MNLSNYIATKVEKITVLKNKIQSLPIDRFKNLQELHKNNYYEFSNIIDQMYEDHKLRYPIVQGIME